MIGAILWDFGDTLVDERWMWAAPPGVPAWPGVWRGLVEEPLFDAWNEGRVDCDAIVAALAERLPLEPAAVRAHMRRCCDAIQFFETPRSLAGRTTLPQAIVTVNPDLFSEWIVPQHRLAERFETIVTSWQERTLDKGALCAVALERLGGGLRGGIPPDRTLLIDNRCDCIAAWEARGGLGYWFQGDARFAADLADPAGPLRSLAADSTSVT